jgi:hypothetical protein
MSSLPYLSCSNSPVIERRTVTAVSIHRRMTCVVPKGKTGPIKICKIQRVTAAKWVDDRMNE